MREDFGGGGGEERMMMDFDVERVVAELMAGGIVTVPTETVEGYAVRLAEMEAIEELMRLKERGYGSGKVFTLVPESREAVAKYAMVTAAAQGLVERYVPGELTLILPKRADFLHPYYDHFGTVGVRVPAHPLFEAILPVVGPLVLTSANVRGGVPRSCSGHLPSTVVDCTGERLRVVRQGGVKIGDWARGLD